MFLYAIRPLFAEVHKVGLWSSDPISLQGRYCTPYGDHDTIYINIGEDETQLKVEETKLHQFLKGKGVWKYGEIFDYSPNLIKEYCLERGFVLTYGTYRMRRPRIKIVTVNEEKITTKECLDPKHLLITYLNHKDGQEPEDAQMKERMVLLDDILSYISLDTICDFDRSYSQEEAQNLAEGARDSNGPTLFVDYSHACHLFSIKRRKPDYYKKKGGERSDEVPHDDEDSSLIWNHHSFFRVISNLFRAAGIDNLFMNYSQKIQVQKVRLRVPRYFLNQEVVIKQVCALRDDLRLQNNAYYQSMLQRCELRKEKCIEQIGLSSD